MRCMWVPTLQAGKDGSALALGARPGRDGPLYPVLLAGTWAQRPTLFRDLWAP